MEAKKVEDAKSNGKWVWLLVVSVVAVLVIAAGVLTILKHFEESKKSSASSLYAGPIVKKHADALEIALQFFDVQKSGKLVNNRIAWRGDSWLQDGKEWNLELSKGMYDAGDLMKFGFPMAFTATMLSWAILEYGAHMKAVKQLGYAQDSLKWITDFLINAHPSKNVLYIQVGDPELDHECWERPETAEERRPLMQVNISYPGTEVAAETAAAMASASLVFKKINSSYSDLLLKHAQQLFTFADTYRGSYSVRVPQVQKYYNSTGFEDELLWAAAWLYHSTKDSSYLRYVTELNGQRFANWGSPAWFSWDDKHAGTQILLSRVNIFGAQVMSTDENLDLQMYRKTSEAIMCELLPDSPTATSSRTDSNFQISPSLSNNHLKHHAQMILFTFRHKLNRHCPVIHVGGLIWVSKWNCLQHGMASAFLAALFSDYMVTSRITTLYCHGRFYSSADLRSFAFSQAEYILGNNPMKMSYLVGCGSKYPQYVHHQGYSIPVHANTTCKGGFSWLDSINPNPNVAVGAVETYIDSRRNWMQAEPTTYNSALIVALLSSLVRTSSLVEAFT